MVYFLHIPKTAGTSLAAAFAAGLSEQGRTMLGPCLLDDLLRPENHDFAKRDLVLGHLGVSLMSYASATVTVLRDPADHLYSWYRHVAREPGHYFHSVVRDEKISFQEWLTDTRFELLTDNPQARCLGMPCEVPRGEWSPTDPSRHQRRQELSAKPAGDHALLAAAKATLASCAVVGTMDDLDLFMRRAGRVLGIETPRLDHLNVDPSRPPTRFSSREIDAIRLRTRLDGELFQVARRRARGGAWTRLAHILVSGSRGH